jgi:hypothetical protein
VNSADRAGTRTVGAVTAPDAATAVIAVIVVNAVIVAIVAIAVSAVNVSIVAADEGMTEAVTIVVRVDVARMAAAARRTSRLRSHRLPYLRLVSVRKW